MSNIDNVNVLDHGYVRLVNVLGDDLSIVRAARVSHSAEWRTGDDADKDEKLLAYMMDHGHTSPFEHAVFTFEVQAPLFVFRQWHRHRTWSYNEVSARYTELPDIFYVPTIGRLGYQGTHNKQGTEGALPEDLATSCVQEIRKTNAMVYEQYKQLLRSGMSRELARIVLPVNTYSRMFGTVDLHNLLKFLEQRMDSHAQYEIRVYAEAIFTLICQHVPTTTTLWADRQNDGIKVRALRALEEYMDRE